MAHWSTKLTAFCPGSGASPSLATLSASMALLRPIASRVVALVPVVLGITVLVFALNAIALGDPARAAMGQRADPETLERPRREYAPDRPLPVQYATRVRRLAASRL